MIDRYKDIRLHHERVDWTRTDLTADVLTSIFLGKVGYWDDEEFEGKGPHEIEKEILLAGGRDNWWQISPYGKPYYQHFLTLMKVLLPKTDITNTIADAVMFFCLGMGFNKILNLIGCQNAGKCLKWDEEVRMYDGTLKQAFEVVTGDLLMGMDSTPRKVLNTCAGDRMLYTLVPTTGRAFTVTENHLVTVVCKRGKMNTHGGKWSPQATPGQLYEFTAKELSEIPQWKLDNFGLLSAEVWYGEKDLPVDPYIYGLWLGDGSKRSPRITVHSLETEILESIEDYWSGEGHKVKYATKKGTRTLTVSLTTTPGTPNPFWTFTQTSVRDSKFILPDYLRGSVEQRLQLLAGLIDTDGTLAGTFYSLCCSDPELMDGYEELANSLGFRTSRTEKATGYFRVETGEECMTENLSICGDIRRIPCRIARKKAPKRPDGKGVRKHGVTGFQVVKHGIDRFAGFEVDGDHRFLLKDYTITHNSAGACRIPFVCMFIDPKFTVGYVASPFDNTADATVWGDIEELWDELCEAWPFTDAKGESGNVPSLFPKGVKYEKKRLVFVPGIPKAGHITLRHIKDTGKLKGSKTRGKQTHRGWMFVVVDEINEIQSHVFLNTLENVSSQDAFYGITSQNFKDEEDMGGQITAPLPKFGGPATFDDLNIETDLWWHSAKSSITLRFDGHRAPNILASKTIYPYLLKQKDLDRLKESGGGEQSLSYYSQARSFPVRGGDLNTVLSKSVLNNSNYKDPHYQLINIYDSVSFCDPAFGGRDSAVYGWCQFGLAAVRDSENVAHNIELMVFKERMKKLPLIKDAVFDEFWFGRMREAGIDTAPFTIGNLVSPEDQIAIQCVELNLRNRVSAANFGFDFSMRPDIVSSVNRMVGFDAVAFDYNQGPTGIYLNGVKQQSEDYCHDRVSELAFLAADIFLTKQIRAEEGLIEPAIIQLQRTYHEIKNKKRKVEKKIDYKARNQGRSPDERDVLMGIAGMAALRGFRPAQVVSGSGAESMWSQLNDLNIGKSRVKPAHV